MLDELRVSERRALYQVMNKEVLESASYPKLKFVSTKVRQLLLKDNQYRVDITGLLNLHGMSNEVDLLRKSPLEMTRFVRLINYFVAERLSHQDRFHRRTCAEVAG